MSTEAAPSSLNVPGAKPSGKDTVGDDMGFTLVEKDELTPQELFNKAKHTNDKIQDPHQPLNKQDDEFKPAILKDLSAENERGNRQFEQKLANKMEAIDLGSDATGHEQALQDPLLQKHIDHSYLSGYLDAVKAFEHHKAYEARFETQDEAVGYLKNKEDRKNPHQIGVRIGYEFEWVNLSYLNGKQDWDMRLNKEDKKKWQPLNLSPIFLTPFYPGTLWEGVHAGRMNARKDFMEKLCAELRARSS